MCHTKKKRNGGSFGNIFLKDRGIKNRCFLIGESLVTLEPTVRSKLVSFVDMVHIWVHIFIVPPGAGGLARPHAAGSAERRWDGDGT